MRRRRLIYVLVALLSALSNPFDVRAQVSGEGAQTVAAAPPSRNQQCSALASDVYATMTASAEKEYYTCMGAPLGGVTYNVLGCNMLRGAAYGAAAGAAAAMYTACMAGL